MKFLEWILILLYYNIHNLKGTYILKRHLYAPYIMTERYESKTGVWFYQEYQEYKFYESYSGLSGDEMYTSWVSTYVHSIGGHPYDHYYKVVWLEVLILLKSYFHPWRPKSPFNHLSSVWCWVHCRVTNTCSRLYRNL